MRASAFVGSPVGERGSQRYRGGGGERDEVGWEGGEEI